jgi:hypothetical protein
LSLARLGCGAILECLTPPNGPYSPNVGEGAFSEVRNI